MKTVLFTDRFKNNLLVACLLLAIGFYDNYFLFQHPDLISAIGLFIHIGLNAYTVFMIFILWSLEKFPKFNRSNILDLSVIAYITTILVLAVKCYPAYQSVERLALTLLLTLGLSVMIFDFVIESRIKYLSGK